MNIAEIIRNGIPKIGTSFMSKTFYDDFHSTPKKFYQVIGYRDYYDELMVDFVTDDYKTLRLEHYTLNDLLSMNLEQGVHVLNKDSIKKINIKDKETNKFYLDMYGIYYKTQLGYSLIFNGINCNIFSRMKNMHSYQEYEITDIREIKKILKRTTILFFFLITLLTSIIFHGLLRYLIKQRNTLEYFYTIHPLGL